MSDLTPGDILFRWLQDEEIQSQYLLRSIVKVQESAISKQLSMISKISKGNTNANITDLLRTIPLYFWAGKIGHVGIYVGDNEVVEVGAKKIGGGLGSKKLKSRDNTDVVVDFPPDVAERIKELAIVCQKNSKAYLYPLQKLFDKDTAMKVLDDKGFKTITKKKIIDKAETGNDEWVGTGWEVMSANPVNPVQDLWSRGQLCRNDRNVFMANWPVLREMEDRVAKISGDNKKLREQFKIGLGSCEPVCSHFVHAILYACVIPEATVWAATKRETEHIFNISPNMLWHYFLNGLGVFRGQGAEFKGVQIKGRIDQEKTDKFQDLVHCSKYKVL